MALHLEVMHNEVRKHFNGENSTGRTREKRLWKQTLKEEKFQKKIIDLNNIIIYTFIAFNSVIFCINNIVKIGY